MVLYLAIGVGIAIYEFQINFREDDTYSIVIVILFVAIFWLPMKVAERRE